MKIATVASVPRNYGPNLPAEKVVVVRVKAKDRAKDRAKAKAKDRAKAKAWAKDRAKAKDKDKAVHPCHRPPRFSLLSIPTKVGIFQWRNSRQRSNR